MAVEKKLFKVEKRINGFPYAPGEFIGIQCNSKSSPELDDKGKPKPLLGDRILAAEGAGRLATPDEAFARLSRKEFLLHGYTGKQFDELHKAAAESKDAAGKALVEMHAKFDAGEAQKARVAKLRENFEEQILAKSSALAS